MSLRQTPLTDVHRALGARMVEFGGWDMPLQYEGIAAEHRAVRGRAGLFDVSHMGELMVEGPGAESLLQLLTPNDVARLKPGRAHYSSLLTDAGTFVDDILVYRMGPSRFMVVMNASNSAKDVAWVRAGADRHARALPGPVVLDDASDRTALLAVQGPASAGILADLYEPGPSGVQPGSLRPYGFCEGGRLGGAPVAVVSRTGYTGEDGFEAYLPAEVATRAWEAILAHGVAKPAGLGARDTLRLEASMCLHGNDIDETRTPYEAGLAWTVKLDKGEFAGRAALARQALEGTAERLVGLEVTGRGIARHGHEVFHGGTRCGVVTSGTHAPTLDKPVAMGYVAAAAAAPGTEVDVDVRGRRIAARVVAMPFYARERA